MENLPVAKNLILTGKSGKGYVFSLKTLKCADALKNAKAEKTSPMKLAAAYANDIQSGAGIDCLIESPGFVVINAGK